MSQTLVALIASGGSLAQVQSFVETKGLQASDVNRTDRAMGVTPLIVCAGRPDEQMALGIAKYLVSKGAGVNVRDTGPGATPLYMAAQWGKPQLMRYFLELGADVKVYPTATCTSGLYVAVSNGHTECVAIYADACIEQGKLDVLDQRNQLHNMTPVWKAAGLAYCEMVGILAKAGADLRCAFPRVYERPSRHVQDELDSFDIEPDPVNSALDQALLSFVQPICSNRLCRKEGTLRCSRCMLARYCSKECQKHDYAASHKHVCKRIRAGMDMIGDPNTPSIPPVKREKYGFSLQFSEDDNELPDDDLDTDGPEYPKWYYNDALPGDQPNWKRYPLGIEDSLERMSGYGGSKYMYKPGDDRASGMSEREMSRTAPPHIATNYVIFSDMIEREIYTGAARAVRRDGPPIRRNRLF